MSPGVLRIARIAPPIIIVAAYGMLMATSNTDHTGKAWMSIGGAFVLVLWFLITYLVGRASRGPDDASATVAALVARADWETTIARLAGATTPQALAQRAIAYAELGKASEARAAIEALPPPPAVAHVKNDLAVAELELALARARVLLLEDRTAAKQALGAIANNIRATGPQRATAKRFLELARDREPDLVG